MPSKAVVLGGSAVLVVLIIILIVYLTVGNKYPDGVMEGDVIGAPGLGIWRAESGKRRWYSGPAYAAAGSPPHKNITVDMMTQIPVGDPM